MQTTINDPCHPLIISLLKSIEYLCDGIATKNEFFIYQPYVECDSDDCACKHHVNFIVRRYNFSVIWYKHIGRGMDINGPIKQSVLMKMYIECLQTMEKFNHDRQKR